MYINKYATDKQYHCHIFIKTVGALQRRISVYLVVYKSTVNFVAARIELRLVGDNSDHHVWSIGLSPQDIIEFGQKQQTVVKILVFRKIRDINAYFYLVSKRHFSVQNKVPHFFFPNGT